MKTKNFIIKDGNLRFPWQVILAIFGIFFLMLPAYLNMSYAMKIFSISIGALFGGVGAYSAKAYILKIKPFDDSYKKARDSYTEKKEE